MSEALVRDLREDESMGDALCGEAADHIEALEGRISDLEEALKHANKMQRITEDNRLSAEAYAQKLREALEFARDYIFGDRGNSPLIAKIDAALSLTPTSALAAVRDEVREECAKIANAEGVHPETNIYGGGADWYRHGKRIAAAIRARKEVGE